MSSWNVLKQKAKQIFRVVEILVSGEFRTKLCSLDQFSYSSTDGQSA